MNFKNKTKDEIQYMIEEQFILSAIDLLNLDEEEKRSALLSWIVTVRPEAEDYL